MPEYEDNPAAPVTDSRAARAGRTDNRKFIRRLAARMQSELQELECRLLEIHASTWTSDQPRARTMQEAVQAIVEVNRRKFDLVARIYDTYRLAGVCVPEVTQERLRLFDDTVRKLTSQIQGRMGAWERSYHEAKADHMQTADAVMKWASAANKNKAAVYEKVLNLLGLHDVTAAILNTTDEDNVRWLVEGVIPPLISRLLHKRLVQGRDPCVYAPDKPTLESRVQAAHSALQMNSAVSSGAGEAATTEDKQDQLVDLLTNLRHYSDVNGLHFDQAVTTSQNHHSYER